MRKLILVLSFVTVAACTGLLTPADAQTSRGAASLPAATENFTPIEKAACGPHRGRWCGPFHHRVCGPRHCWCAPC